MTTAIILAGGLGTRLRPAVPKTPKPMAPVKGRPFLEYLMDYWLEQGVSRFILSIGYKGRVISEYFGSSYRGCPIDYVIEKIPLGTGGGLLLGLERIENNERFLALNGDTFFECDLKNLKQFAETHKADWCLSLYRSRDTERYMGVQLSESGRILSLKTSASNESCLINAGVYLVNPDSLAGRHSAGEKLSLEDDVLPDALSAGQTLCGLESEGRFIDIGIPGDYYRAPEILAR